MRCPQCLGVGKTRVSPYQVSTCPLCSGQCTVTIDEAERWLRDHPKASMARRVFEAETRVPCLDCNGTGSVNATKQAEQRQRLQPSSADSGTRTRKPEGG